MRSSGGVVRRRGRDRGTVIRGKITPCHAEGKQEQEGESSKFGVVDFEFAHAVEISSFAGAALGSPLRILIFNSIFCNLHAPVTS